ncbi:hypothetical protein O3G_MSEX004036 [Manduca sexta]|uniref:Cytochrome P450 n=1 Tax=Manduca sexta TaxID=7130 RepID=A0A922CG83_MANSE|nr:hypothetical protein O3G_MSEX004036 [Manduca sexta]
MSYRHCNNCHIPRIVIQLFIISDDLFNYGRELYAKYGKLSKITGFHIRGVNVYSPEDAETILSSPRYNEKQIPYIFLEPWLGDGLLISKGEKWHDRRKMLTPAFHFNILKKFTKVFCEETEEFLNLVKEETKKDKTEIMPLIMKSTIRIMCETSMGTSMDEDIHTVLKKYLKAIHVLGECVVYRFSRSWFYTNFTFFLSKVAGIQRRAVKDLHIFTKQIIQERRRYRKQGKIVDINDDDEVYGKKSRMAMLDLLLEQEKLGNIDEDGIREEVDTFMFEGHDTTSMLLTFMIMRIANEQHVQDLIYEEMQRIFGDSRRSPTMEDFSEMKYLECCIKEALRLYPSVPFMSRILNEEVTLSGYKVPEGTQCNIHVFDIHRLEEYYPEPEKFVPERFLAENKSTRHPFAYIPFSAGPRNCIGQRFAMLEIKTMMSGLIRRFHLQPVTKHEDVAFLSDLVLRPKYPIYVRFRERKM